MSSWCIFLEDREGILIEKTHARILSDLKKQKTKKIYFRKIPFFWLKKLKKYEKYHFELEFRWKITIESREFQICGM